MSCSILLPSYPYESPEDYVEASGGICALIPEGKGEYRMETFQNEGQAEEAGALVTHHGACGACSSLQELAVSIEIPIRRRLCVSVGFSISSAGREQVTGPELQSVRYV